MKEQKRGHKNSVNNYKNGVNFQWSRKCIYGFNASVVGLFVSKRTLQFSIRGSTSKTRWKKSFLDKSYLQQGFISKQLVFILLEINSIKQLWTSIASN